MKGEKGWVLRVLVLMTISSCSSRFKHQRIHTNTVVSSNHEIFSSNAIKEKWLKDSLGCDGYRMELYKTVESNAVGLSRQSILNQLGKPNELVGNTYFVYYISSKCEPGIGTNTVYNLSDLTIMFKDDVVYHVLHALE